MEIFFLNVGMKITISRNNLQEGHLSFLSAESLCTQLSYCIKPRWNISCRQSSWMILCFVKSIVARTKFFKHYIGGSDRKNIFLGTARVLNEKSTCPILLRQLPRCSCFETDWTMEDRLLLFGWIEVFQLHVREGFFWNFRLITLWKKNGKENDFFDLW